MSAADSTSPPAHVPLLRRVLVSGGGGGDGPQPAADGRLFRLWAVALLLLCCLGLGRAPLFDVDEGAFSEASREMVASGDWGHTTLNGSDRFDKPILVYWLQAGSAAVLGNSEFALRLPSALCTWAWALALALFARPRWGTRTAVLAGTLLASSLGVMLIGRAATADALLNLLLTLATLDLWRWAELKINTPEPSPVVHKLARSLGRAPSGEAAIAKLFVNAAGVSPVLAPRVLRRAALWIGLGLLAKGPVALLVPGAALVLWCLFAGQWRLIGVALRDPWAWAIVIAVAAPWYGYALWRHGQAFIDGFFIKHNLARYGGALEGHGGGLAYYVVVLPMLLLPWSALLGPMVWRPGRLWAEPLPRFLVLWALFVLVFFSFSGTKLPHYLLYGFSPVVLLAARWLADLDDVLPRTRLRLAGGAPAGGAGTAGRADRPDVKPQAFMLPLLVLSMAGLLALGALLPLYLPGIAAQQQDALYRTLLGGAVDLPALTRELWLGLAPALLLVLVAGFWPARTVATLRLTPSTRAALAGVVTALACTWFVLPWWGERLQAPVKQSALLARDWLAGGTALPLPADPAAAAAASASSPATNPALPLPARRQVVQWRLHQPSFAFYLGRPTLVRAPRQGELAFVRLDRLPPAQASPQRWRLLHQGRGYGLLLWLDEQSPAPDGGP
jgi:4-amino-4-deoxy-L-arabinose transferase-like glycosyltransferase